MEGMDAAMYLLVWDRSYFPLGMIDKICYLKVQLVLFLCEVVFGKVVGPVNVHIGRDKKRRQRDKLIVSISFKRRSVKTHWNCATRALRCTNQPCR